MVKVAEVTTVRADYKVMRVEALNYETPMIVTSYLSLIKRDRRHPNEKTKRSSNNER